jgi:hypothetical protein
MGKETKERLDKIEERQEALMEVVGTILEWEYDNPRQFFDQHLTEKKKSAERLHRQLLRAFDFPDDLEHEEEPGEDQEWKTCDACGGTGIAKEEVVGNKFHYEDCESCDGKGKYIDDMD